MKVCAECKYHDRGNCTNSNVTKGKVDIVSGKATAYDCKSSRINKDKCGIEAQYFNKRFVIRVHDWMFGGGDSC